MIKCEIIFFLNKILTIQWGDRLNKKCYSRMWSSQTLLGS